jgi:hypothetical protein
MFVMSTYLQKECLHIRRALAINSEKNMPVRVMNSAGYVQKIPAVEFAPVTVRILAPPSNTSIADL